MNILETEHLFLREFTEADTDFIIKLLNTPGWLEFIGDRNVRTTEEAAGYLLNGPIRSYRENGFGLCMVVHKDDNIPIGMCGLIRRDSLDHVDIGFALMPEYAGKGYAYEIASATMKYGFESLKLDKIVAITSANNTRSISLLNKLGLRFEKMITLPGDGEPLMLFS